MTGVQTCALPIWIKEYVGGCAFGETVEPLTVLDENGALKPEVCQIMAVCKEYGAILGSGHVGPDECLALAREAHRIGYTKLEITHPNDWEGGFSIELCRGACISGRDADDGLRRLFAA